MFIECGFNKKELKKTIKQKAEEDRNNYYEGEPEGTRIHKQYQPVHGIKDLTLYHLF